ncbi:hypothetical protein [Actinomadura sp. WMMA1423]|nr:hypothetical protein [Actinomadura sp. WMMA1423]
MDHCRSTLIICALPDGFEPGFLVCLLGVIGTLGVVLYHFGGDRKDGQ